MNPVLRLAFWAATLFAFVMATLPQPMIELSSSDKLQHMLAFLVLTLLGSAAFRGVSRLRLMLAMTAFGGLIEIVQMVPELHRDAEWSDWLADILAVLIGIAVAHLFERWALRPAD